MRAGTHAHTLHWFTYIHAYTHAPYTCTAHSALSHTHTHTHTVTRTHTHTDTHTHTQISFFPRFNLFGTPNGAILSVFPLHLISAAGHVETRTVRVKTEDANSQARHTLI